MTATLLQQLLEATAARSPERSAVAFDDQALSYGELEAASNRLAWALRREGVRRGDRVAIYTQKSLVSAIAVHGVLKSGGAYVPLDPGAPPGRLAYILGNCGVRHLVASTAKAGALGRVLQEGARLDAVLFADAAASAPAPLGGPRVVPWSEIAGGPAEPPPLQGGPDDLAYVLYTSGSTGTPKGVMITHANALAFVDWAAERYGLSPEDRVSSHAPLHFDLSIFDFYSSMRAGASLALVPDGTSTFPIRLSEWIERRRVTVWYSVPSILTQLLLKGRLEQRDLSSLRLVLFAGEVFPTKYLRALMSALPHVRFANLYGPTETNVITYYDVPPLAADRDAPIPIGYACSYAELLVLDDKGEAVSGPGRAGELYARSPTVAQGYWGDPDKTARAFVPDPLRPDAGTRVYRTGDLVEWAPDGALLFQGRRDRMVKSRGYRIELDEIETTLYAHPEVREAAVVAVPDEQIGSRILAFVSGADGASLAPGKLREYCLERLPRYMVPEAIELLPQLPKTSTGKVDRTRLAGGG